MATMTEKLEQEQGRSGSATGVDLKRRLVEHFDMLKRPNDLVKITQVTSHHFRVNTLSPRTVEHGLMPVYRIIKSQFLHVEELNGELVITDQTRY